MDTNNQQQEEAKSRLMNLSTQLRNCLRKTERIGIAMKRKINVEVEVENWIKYGIVDQCKALREKDILDYFQK